MYSAEDSNEHDSVPKMINDLLSSEKNISIAVIPLYNLEVGLEFFNPLSVIFLTIQAS